MDGMGSHLEVQVAAAVQSGILWPGSGILELGAGDYSTPILHQIAQAQGRPMLSIGSGKDWLDRFLGMESATHKFRLIEIEDWPTCDFSGDWGMALLDSDQAHDGRFMQLPRLGHVKLVAMHDTKHFSTRHWNTLKPIFKHIVMLGLRYPIRPASEEIHNAGILSNFVDPSPWFHPGQVERF